MSAECLRAVSSAVEKTGVDAVAALLQALGGSGERVLIFDDQLIPALSLFVHGDFLRRFGLEKWYRLSVWNEIAAALETRHSAARKTPLPLAPAPPPLQVIILARDTLSATYHVCHFLPALEKAIAPAGLSADITVAFLPQRRPVLVKWIASVLEKLRQTAPVSARESLRTEGSAQILRPLCSSRLQVRLRDVQIPLFSLDEMVYSQEIIGADRQLKIEGNMGLLDSLADGVAQIASLGSMSDLCSIYGFGPYAETLAKKIKHKLVPPQDDTVAALEAMRVKADGERLAQAFETGSRYLTDEKENETEANKQTGAKSFLALQPPVPIAVPTMTTAIHELLDQMVATGDASLTADAQKFMEEELAFLRGPVDLIKDDLTKMLEDENHRILFPTQTYKPSAALVPLFSLRSIVVIDRNVDWISPFVAPVTYEALLDLNWDVRGGHLVLPAGSVGDNEPMRLRLNHQDAVYRQVRGLSRTKLGEELHHMAREMQTTLQQRDGNRGNVDQLKQLVEQLKERGGYAGLANHINLVSHVTDKVVRKAAFYTLLKLEDEIMSGSLSYSDVCSILCGMIERKYPQADILRLQILNSWTKIDQYDRKASLQLLRMMTLYHGIEAGYQWTALEEAGIMYNGMRDPLMAFSDWGSLRNALQLMKDDSAASTEEDLSFVHSGYTPISIRLLHSLFEEHRLSWRRLQEVVPESMIVNRLRLHPTLSKAKAQTMNAAVKEPVAATIVVMPGGTTRSEISALRQLVKLKDRAFILVTPEIIEYRRFLDNFHWTADRSLHWQADKDPLTLRPRLPPYDKILRSVIA